MTRRHTSKCIRRAFGIAGLLVVLGLGNVPVQAQEVLPEFAVDIVSARSDGEPSHSRVDVYARIGYASLNFITTPNGFSASYEMSLAAIEVNEDQRLRNIVQSPIWDGNILVDTYVETQSDDRSDFTTQSLELEPGNYIFEFELTDKNSNQVFVREVSFSVRNFDQPTTISDITLLDSYDPETFTIVPRVDSNIYTSDGGFQVFYEVYSDAERSVSITREVIRTRRDGGIPVEPVRTVSEMADPGEVVISESERTVLPVGKSQHLVTIPVEEIRAGAYSIIIQLVDENGEVLDQAEKSFVAQWSGLAAHLLDIDEAIQQLEISAKKKDLNYILDGTNQFERFQRFQNYWEKRDPTPNTRRNEAMEEYYYRVASANRKYGAVQDGWKTDRGFVFVRWGEPDFTERRPHNFDYKPYEIWIYERIGRQFIFIDKTGFGDYELLVPVWDERTRLY